MRCLFVTTVLAAAMPQILRAEDKPIDVPIGSPKYRLIGKLHEPLGTVLTVQGFIVDGPFKGYEGGPNIVVQRINGRATQEHIRIKLEKGWTEIGADLLKPKAGMSVELKGYETGKFVGVPNEALKGLTLRPQVPVGLGFTHTLMFHEVKRLDPVILGPADLVDREALLEGKAVNRDGKAYIDGDVWRLFVNAGAPWPKETEGKIVEGLGTIRKADGANQYRLEKGTTRLVRLSDQLGREVNLRGTAWSMNGHWWFDYRGTNLYVEGMKELPGWTVHLHAEPVLIRGVLDEAKLPDLDQITLKSKPDSKKYFIVRKAEWKQIDALLTPERLTPQRGYRE